MRDVLRWVVLGGIFVLPFAALVVAHGMLFPFITGKNFTFRIIVEIMVASWAVLALLDRAYRPTFSWILAAFGAFVAVMGVANALGVAPEHSFWSNYERMEGYITLLHVFGYFVVTASVLTTEKLWNAWLNTTLLASVIVTLYGYAQLGGLIEIRQSTSRVDGPFGNAAYMAVHLLVHVFFALLMLARSTKAAWRLGYALIAALAAFLILFTATRGALVGLVGGLVVTALYIAVCEREHLRIRKIAIGSLIGVGVLVSVFFAIKDTSFVARSEVLSRAASISLDAGSTRFTLWRIALKGVAERPILGWGQGNYSRVFVQYYEPSLYGQEPWFDHVHNTLLDWLVAGGIVGLAAYLFTLGAAAWYAMVPPRREGETLSLTTVERGILLGLLAAYFIQNQFVFDNLISYLLFATILALLHQTRKRTLASVDRIRVEKEVVVTFIAPALALVLLATVYTLNVPPMRASLALIDALTAANAGLQEGEVALQGRRQALEDSLSTFKRALAYNSFGTSEIREQLATTARRLYKNQYVPADVQEAFLALARDELHAETKEDAQPPRALILLGAFYRETENYEASLKALLEAQTFSPRKQRTLLELGFTYLESGSYEKAQEIFEEALAYAPEYAEGREYAIVAAIRAGDEVRVRELAAPPYEALYKTSERILYTYYAVGNYPRAISLIDEHIAASPQDIQLRISKSVMQHEAGDTAAAIATLREAVNEFPEFREQGEAFIEELRTSSRR